MLNKPFVLCFEFTITSVDSLLFVGQTLDSFSVGSNSTFQKSCRQGLLVASHKASSLLQRILFRVKKKKKKLVQNLPVWGKNPKSDHNWN